MIHIQLRMRYGRSDNRRCAHRFIREYLAEAGLPLFHGATDFPHPAIHAKPKAVFRLLVPLKHATDMIKHDRPY